MHQDILLNRSPNYAAKTPVQFDRLKMVASEAIKKQSAPTNPAQRLFNKAISSGKGRTIHQNEVLLA